MKKILSGILFSSLILVVFTTKTTQKVEATEWKARTVEQVKKDLRNNNEYIIQLGDTLSVISSATNINMETLQALNNIQNMDLIIAGNKLSFDNNVVQITDQSGEVISEQKIISENKNIEIPNTQNTDLEAELESTSTNYNEWDGNIDPIDEEIVDDEVDNNPNIVDPNWEWGDFPLWEIYDSEQEYTTEEEAVAVALEKIELAKKVFNTDTDFSYMISINYNIETQMTTYRIVLY